MEGMDFDKSTLFLIIIGFFYSWDHNGFLDFKVLFWSVAVTTVLWKEILVLEF